MFLARHRTTKLPSSSRPLNNSSSQTPFSAAIFFGGRHRLAPASKNLLSSSHRIKHQSSLGQQTINHHIKASSINICQHASIASI